MITQRVAAKAVIVRDGKILLLREANTYDEGTNTGRYHFPGGRIEPGESYREGLRREVLEETGLHVREIGAPIYIGEWFPIIKGDTQHIVAIFLEATVENGDIALSSEHDAYVWVDRDNARNIDIMSPDNDVVQQYFKNKEKR